MRNERPMIRILIADDDAGLKRILIDALMEAGYELSETVSGTLCSRLEDVEREHILRVLGEAGGHRGKAAELLGIAPKTLYNKLMSYGMNE